MFHEYRDIVAKLKNSDDRFKRLFEEHNQLDAKLNRSGEHMSDMEAENLKKQKLKCKDELYQMILTDLKKKSIKPVR